MARIKDLKDAPEESEWCYIAQERAFAPGIVKDWPEIIPHPTNPNGRLVKYALPKSLKSDARLAQAIADIKAGKCDAVESVDELIAYINQETSSKQSLEAIDE